MRELVLLYVCIEYMLIVCACARVCAGEREMD